MRRQRGLVGLMGLAALVALGVTAQPVAAKVTTEQSASILIFPKVIANGQRDTIIQITNTSNTMRHAHCFYVNGSTWTEIDFDIWLTKQQPTHWVVSTGRLDDPTYASCRQTSCDPDTSGTPDADCCDAGFPPGRVPPVVPDFAGELKCIEVTDSGEPVSGNALKGEATLVDPVSGDVSKYNAVGIKGNDNNNMDNVLCLGGGVTAECPRGAEYDACPQTWLLDHPAVGAPDPIVDQQPFCTEGDCSYVDTNLTVVPCTENFETQAPPFVTLQFVIINEYEQALSASTTFQCWKSYKLEDISSAFLASTIGGVTLQTRMRTFEAAQAPKQNIGGGVIAVLEETHGQCSGRDGDRSGCTTGTETFVSRAAANGHTTFTDQIVHDLITIPNDQVVGPQ